MTILSKVILLTYNELNNVNEAEPDKNSNLLYDSVNLYSSYTQ